ncbi:MAG: transporter substrate-binding domain-containing protein [Candidatus Competibacter sp.]|nr:transporter substrate-binding domain-containing protein [Candidatus Competibacter sp.]
MTSTNSPRRSIQRLTIGWFAFALALLAAPAAARAAGEHTVLLLGNQSLPPLIYLQHGKPTGLVIDLAEAMAAHMRRPVEIRAMDWAEAQQRVLKGEADALLQINANPERERVLDFSEPLLRSEFTIYVAQERFGIVSLPDLRGLKVGVEAKGLPISLLREDPRIVVEIIPDFAAGFRMLVAGQVDAVIADRWVGNYVLAENGIHGVKPVERPINTSYSAIAVKKGNADLLAEINAALAALRRDGTYEAILERWRAKEVVFKTVEQERWQFWLLTGLALALLAALGGIASLAWEIRKRRRMELALRESERLKSDLLGKLNAAQRCAKIGSWDWDKVRDTVWWSDELYRIFELTPGEFTPSFEANSRYIHPDDVGAYYQVFETALQSDDALDFEIRIIANNGIVKHCNAKGVVERDRDGRPTRIFGTLMDITERKRAEAELDQHRHHLEEQVAARTAELEKANNALDRLLQEQQAILHSPVVGIVMLEERVMTWVNEAYATMMGYRPEELIGQPTRMFYPSETAYNEFKERAYPVILADQTFRTEIQYVRKDGSLQWFDIAGARLSPPDYPQFSTPC